MYAAYRNQVPVLLCGPNGADIADSFSYALCGAQAGTLRLKRDFDVDDLREALPSFSPIIKVEHAIDRMHSGSIPELLRTCDNSFFFFLHPFVEDIQMEPNSLLSYVSLLLTDTFVERMPEKGYEGGRPASQYLDYESQRRSHNSLLKLTSLRIMPLVQSRMQQLAKAMSLLLPEETMDSSFLYCTLPYAYASMQAERVIEEVKGAKVLREKISNKALSEAEYFYGNVKE